MKKFILSTLILAGAYGLAAQDNAKARGAMQFSTFNDFDVKKGFHCGWDKGLKKSSTAGLVRGSIHFKNITSGNVLLGKGQGRETVRSWAILEGVSDQTLQEITDEFAVIFQQKLEKIGINGFDGSAFKSSKTFAKLTEKTSKTEDAGQLIGRVKVKTANSMPYNRYNNLKTPGLYSKLAKDAGGDAYSYDIVVDFARFDIQASRWKSAGYGPGYDFINTKTSSDVMPQIAIKQSNEADRLKLVTSNLTLINDKKMYSTLNLMKNLFYNENYATEVDSFEGEMPAAIKKGIQINTRTTGTFVIKADEKKYKEVVLKALSSYADLMMEHIETQIR